MNDTSPDRAHEDITEPDLPERPDTHRHDTQQGRTERELRAALETLAGGVSASPSPDAFRTARGDWLRRERRRRLVLAVLTAVVFTLAVLIGLWVLNHAPADPGVIFSGTRNAVVPGAVSGVSP
ncbi:hypothetical protein PV396_10720 [Streptomyces sp. ME02-8801-2C]|uniref:hypothetical protein n=1 Tax=Streptomyces sp. ME02-8801-2C TaxID=3028680 RepID=UPI0029AD71BA|nr:hypothetical protein [Streptomyces sp. ME02-8801-2C]MDX3452412.1 hypothetical protein [Streptomyces sp. ME02-8801-2C]